MLGEGGARSLALGGKEADPYNLTSLLQWWRRICWSTKSTDTEPNRGRHVTRVGASVDPHLKSGHRKVTLLQREVDGDRNLFIKSGRAHEIFYGRGTHSLQFKKWSTELLGEMFISQLHLERWVIKILVTTLKTLLVFHLRAHMSSCSWADALL